MKNKGLQLFIIATVLLLIGVIVPLLMVIKVLESTLLLNFLAYTSSLSGFLIGIFGVAYYFRGKKK